MWTRPFEGKGIGELPSYWRIVLRKTRPIRESFGHLWLFCESEHPNIFQQRGGR